MNNNATEVIAMWKQFIETDKEWHLYMHVPFCHSACKYCFYTGNLVKDSDYKEKYDKYFYQYLPKVIKYYKELMIKKPFTSVYIGGGSPNAMTPQTMRDTFDLLPGFKDIKVKAIDLHPAFTSKEQIDVLAEYGFTLACFGVQTLDEETLKANDRIAVKKEKLKELVKHCKEKGMYTSVDLMCFLNTYAEDDINQLEKDLDFIETLDLDFIAINPNLHLVLHDNNLARLFVERMNKRYHNHNDYITESEINGGQVNDRFIFRVINKKVKDIYYEKVLTYYADDFPEAVQNILGIGDMQNPKHTMSYIKGEFFYTEHNVNDEPYFDIKYKKQNNNRFSLLKNKLNKIT